MIVLITTLLERSNLPVLDDWHVQVFIEPNEAWGGEGQGQEVRQGEPIPVLSENLGKKEK